MIDTEKFIINLHKEINRRKMRKQRIYNTIYLNKQLPDVMVNDEN